MSTQELDQKFFSRERIRLRMVRRAAEIWGFSESEIDDFDPLVILLLEACAVELEKVAGEIGNTRQRMMDRLAQLLYPGTISVQPAYGIIQVTSSEPEATLYPDAQFTYKPVLADRNKKDGGPSDIYFSPVQPTRIVDGSVRYIATGRELFIMDEGVQRRSIASAAARSVDAHHSLWVGILLNEELDSLQGLSFFFNWLNEPDSDSWFPWLPYTSWSAAGMPLQHSAAQTATPTDEDAEGVFGKEFDGMQKIEAAVSGLFQRNFVTITGAHPIRRMPYPAAFTSLFDSAALKALKDPLAWIEIRWPGAIPADALDTVTCTINAVPVINRRLNHMTYKLGQTLNIVPLETADTFLSIRDITGSLGQKIQPAAFTNPESLEKETYTLRYGINRFDERNAYETLVNLTEVIREESAFFSSLGEDFMIHHIRELKQVLARLEEKLRAQQKKAAPHPYLMVRAGTEGASISIDFWTCSGSGAGKIPVGSRLLPYKNSHVRTSSLYFITPVYGGRDKFSDAARIDHYKSLLLTHDRIVTIADLRSVVARELGRSVKKIEYKKAYLRGVGPRQGFTRCIQIIVTPEPGNLDAQGWQQRLHELRLLLEKSSANNIPFQLTLANTAAT